MPRSTLRSILFGYDVPLAMSWILSLITPHMSSLRIFYVTDHLAGVGPCAYVLFGLLWNTHMYASFGSSWAGLHTVCPPVFIICWPMHMDFYMSSRVDLYTYAQHLVLHLKAYIPYWLNYLRMQVSALFSAYMWISIGSQCIYKLFIDP